MPSKKRERMGESRERSHLGAEFSREQDSAASRRGRSGFSRRIGSPPASRLSLREPEVGSTRGNRSMLATELGRIGRPICIDAVRDVLYELDEKGCLVYVSASVKELMGYTPEQVTGSHFSLWISGEQTKASTGTQKMIVFSVVESTGDDRLAPSNQTSDDAAALTVRLSVALATAKDAASALGGDLQLKRGSGRETRFSVSSACHSHSPRHSRPSATNCTRSQESQVLLRFSPIRERRRRPGHATSHRRSRSHDRRFRHSGRCKGDRSSNRPQ